MGHDIFTENTRVARHLSFSAVVLVAPTILATLSACSVDYDLPAQEVPDEGIGDGAGGESGSVGNEGGVDTGDTGEVPPESCVAQEATAVQILTDNCGACHGPGGNASAGIDYINSVQALVDNGLIAAGSPNDSTILRNIVSGAMPPAGVDSRPTEDDVVILETFIRECTAGTDAGCEDQPFISDREIMDIILNDIYVVDADDRPFTRYFTLAHMYNSGFCGDQRQEFIFAVSKLINALSSEVNVVPPVPVDPEQLVLRINLRDYGWDEPAADSGLTDKWELLTRQSPVAFQRLGSDAETLTTLLETDIPFMPGDAFVAAASRSPLYDSLVGTPDTLADLEARLGVDLQGDIADEEVWRAGVLESGVALQNRLIEGHGGAVAGQAIWITYDFERDVEAQNLFARPLDFEHVAGEVIYTLPNGFQAFMVIDDEGNALEEADDDILVDPSLDNNNVVNGLSCFGCHTRLISAQDEIREFVLSSANFTQDEKDTVEALHPPHNDFQAILDQQTAALHASFTAASVPTDLEGEPILGSALRYDFFLDITRLAAELGVSELTLQTNLGALSPALAPLGLPGGQVSRELVEDQFHEIVCALNLGLVPGVEECLARSDDEEEEDDDDEAEEEPSADDGTTPESDTGDPDTGGADSGPGAGPGADSGGGGCYNCN